MESTEQKVGSLKACDGGYLSFAIGCDERFQTYFSPMLYLDYIIAMDSHESMRKKLYSDYKGQRADRRALDPIKEERYRRVQEFKLTLWQYPDLRCWEYPGLESDDLVALLAWRHQSIDLLGVDKDLHQLGSMINRMYRIGGETSKIDNFFNKLAKGLQDTQRTSENVLFLLALMGDKSDNIPRLVPPYSIPIFHSLIHSQNKWNDAYQEYGLQFLLNLYLVTLPFPGLFGVQPLALLSMIAQNEWKPNHFLWSRLELFHPRLYQDIKQYTGK